MTLLCDFFNDPVGILKDAITIAAVWLALLACVVWEMVIQGKEMTDRLPCGHPMSAAGGNGTTHYCKLCEWEALYE